MPNLYALDYQGFAAENPEKLARAIERGIPSTLRGMMWYANALTSRFENHLIDP